MLEGKPAGHPPTSTGTHPPSFGAAEAPRGGGARAAEEALDSADSAGAPLAAPEELLVQVGAHGRPQLKWFYDEALLDQLTDPQQPLKRLYFEVRQQSSGANGRLRTRVHACPCLLPGGSEEVHEQRFTVEGGTPGTTYVFSVRACAEFEGMTALQHSAFCNPVSAVVGSAALTEAPLPKDACSSAATENLAHDAARCAANPQEDCTEFLRRWIQEAGVKAAASSSTRATLEDIATPAAAGAVESGTGCGSAGSQGQAEVKVASASDVVQSILAKAFPKQELQQPIMFPKNFPPGSEANGHAKQHSIERLFRHSAGPAESMRATVAVLTQEEVASPVPSAGPTAAPRFNPPPVLTPPPYPPPGTMDAAPRSPTTRHKLADQEQRPSPRPKQLQHQLQTRPQLRWDPPTREQRQHLSAQQAPIVSNQQALEALQQEHQKVAQRQLHQQRLQLHQQYMQEVHPGGAQRPSLPDTARQGPYVNVPVVEQKKSGTNALHNWLRLPAKFPQGPTAAAAIGLAPEDPGGVLNGNWGSRGFGQGAPRSRSMDRVKEDLLVTRADAGVPKVFGVPRSRSFPSRLRDEAPAAPPAVYPSNAPSGAMAAWQAPAPVGPPSPGWQRLPMQQTAAASSWFGLAGPLAHCSIARSAGLPFGSRQASFSLELGSPLGGQASSSSFGALGPGPLPHSLGAAGAHLNSPQRFPASGSFGFSLGMVDVDVSATRDVVAAPPEGGGRPFHRHSTGGCQGHNAPPPLTPPPPPRRAPGFDPVFSSWPQEVPHPAPAPPQPLLPPPPPPPIAVSHCGPAHVLHVRTGENNWATLSFWPRDDVHQVCQSFIQQHGLRGAFFRGLVERVHQMVIVGEETASVDVVDLI